MPKAQPDFIARLFSSADPGAELHLVLTAIAALAAIVYPGIDLLINHRHFEVTPFCEGIGWLLAGCGAAGLGAGLQRKAQNDPPQEEPHV